LTFAHDVTSLADGCRVDVRITLAGPLARVWMVILGKGLRTSVQADLERLAEVAERAHSTAP
jgi:hypothetical protein